MRYTKLGHSELKVSELCLGTMTFGEQNSEAEAHSQLDLATQNGINFIDVAEMYPIPPKPETQGLSEAYIGSWLKKSGQRDKLVLATKVTGRGDRNPGLEHVRCGPRLSAEHISAACEGSLKRLQTDCIDLYQLHWPERACNFFGRLEYSPDSDDGHSIEESLTALSLLVKQGKIRYIGISNETPWGLSEYLRLSRELGLERIVAIQNPYNLLNRSFDIGLSEISLREQVGLLAYSPLAFGTLSGKYLNGQMPEGSRLSISQRFGRYSKTNCNEAIAAYVALAREFELDPAQMALAWVNQRAAVLSNIIGATSCEQLSSNIASVDIELSTEQLDLIDAVHQRYPNPAP
ncbi:NADP(H)-dependent aldo-keto reductase [Agaribacterium haliotis]|uniref:NADP(H)-dependent aldo-keto reductase n=1 Tax=Agaribacterium haliotis TaxID=2013869 RepID=UPI000BB54F86|nr:NADP(H)-dependent aldo-keto reductase [Agaribacterium haliotis]